MSNISEKQKTSDFEMSRFSEIPRKNLTLLVGIDGCGGSGKSTFANKIKKNLPNSEIVRMDDFYDGEQIDWLRVKRQVLGPLSRNQYAEYQVYDWHRSKLAGWKQVNVGKIVIIEGIFSLKKELSEFYDFKIWIDCPRELRFQRGIERDGEAMKEKWLNDWMPSEDMYVDNENPDKFADLVLLGI